jgi:hypothetical protein
MTVVYSLRRNKAFVSAVQEATCNTEEFGIEPTHGLFGSDEWWRRIASGELPIQSLSGVITKVYMSGMHDWPEFAMRSDSGEESRWTREVNTKEQDRLYLVGSRIEIDYVNQTHRRASFHHGAVTKCVIEVRIGNSFGGESGAC